ncbi:DMT family transporter [Caldovatus aquaticus]|uniref:DMT family transporter n=1 Tax=Caldovatus aquaticus TaxID=2865671 RepID=UPI0034E2EBB4
MRGPALLVAGMVLFGLLDANSKLLSGQYGLGQVVFLRYAVLAIALLVARMLRPGAGGGLGTRHPGLHALRAAAMMVSAGGFFLAFRRLSLAEGYLVFFTAPFWVLALAALALREPVPRAAWGWSALAFAGVGLAVAPRLVADAASLSAAGYAFALAATLAYAVTQTVNRRLRGEAGAARVLLWPTLLGLALYGPLAALDWTTPPPRDAALLALNGLFAGAAVVCVAAAFRHADAARLAPFNFVGLPVALLLDLALWGTWPEATTLLGGAVVVFACLRNERAMRRRDAPHAGAGPRR